MAPAQLATLPPQPADLPRGELGDAQPLGMLVFADAADQSPESAPPATGPSCGGWVPGC